MIRKSHDTIFAQFLSQGDSVQDIGSFALTVSAEAVLQQRVRASQLRDGNSHT